MVHKYILIKKSSKYPIPRNKMDVYNKFKNGAKDEQDNEREGKEMGRETVMVNQRYNFGLG